MTLKKYKEKRTFEETPEPKGSKAKAKAEDAPLSFGVQKHAATRLHCGCSAIAGGGVLGATAPRGARLIEVNPFHTGVADEKRKGR